MSINKVNTTAEEQSFKFLTNQSSILHTVDTNKITVNGVNVIVDKPKRGDVMCITHYTTEDGTLLDADKQKVVWIDGLSIDPKQLSQEYEPVGICLVVKGNKAIVRYREERSLRWSAGERWELPNSSIMNDGAKHTLKITLNGVENPTPLVLTDTISREEFVDKLNRWFISSHNPNYSAELVELNTDLPAVDKSDNKDGDSYRNRVIVNASFTTNAWNTINIEGIGAGTRAIGKHIKRVNWYYLNNGFKRNWEGGCCRAKYYDYIQDNQTAPTVPMTNVNIINAGGIWLGRCPVRLVDFTSSKCQILRDNFANYNEYLESMLAKFPCGAGGTITEFPSGKENTYNLANCTFYKLLADIGTESHRPPLYPAANWAASISLNAPKLGKGNWWLPSSAEITEIMRDITYGTSFWTANPDIINRVLAKLTSISDSGWSMLSADTPRWTSSRFDETGAYSYYAHYGVLFSGSFYFNFAVSPITIYEF